MSETAINDVLNGGMPSVFPSEQELEAWNALSRQEQIERFQVELNSAECSNATDSTMEDVKKRALERLVAEKP